MVAVEHSSGRQQVTHDCCVRASSVLQYPDENSYAAFLSAHGGSSNAYTSTENTNYFFDVTHSHLEEAVDRFSQFFKAPLFTASCVEREQNAVHSENAKNLQVDTWRFFQLLKSTSSPDHPFSKFGTGNHETLRDTPKERGINVREELIKFHREKYSSDIMRLCIIGRESLDRLEAIVTEQFSSIPRGNARPVFGKDAMTAEQLSRHLTVIPVKDQRTMQLLWHIDAPVRHLFDTKPLELISHCLGHESAGSILSHLKQLNYANGLSAGLKSSSTSFTLFTVSIDLTETGLQHTDDIAETVFSYLVHALRGSLQQTPHRWEDVFKEVQAVNAMGFQFKSKESPINLVSSFSSSLQTFPPERVLNGPYEINRYDPTLLAHFLDALTATSNLRIHVVGQKFKDEFAAAGKTMSKERWYQTEYVNEPISDALLARLANPPVVSSLALPAINDFIATDFTLKHPQLTPAEIASKVDYAPVQLSDALSANHPLSSVWFKADRTFGMPKSNILLRFVMPLAYASPTNALLASLFAQLLNDELNEYAYASTIAGLSYSFYSTQQGLQLSVGGYSQKQTTLLQAILKQITSLSIVQLKKEADFYRIKEKMKRGLLNFPKENPYSHAMFDELGCMQEHLWTHQEKLASIDALTPAQLDDFAAQLLSHAELDLFVHGNVAQSDVRAIATQVQEVIPVRPLYASQLALNRAVQLSPAVSYLRQRPALNPVDANSASLNLYQLGENTVELHAVAELFAHLVREPLFNRLRTKEQLGYLVWSNLVTVHGVLHFRVLLQSAHAGADYLNYRVESFLQWYRDVELPRALAADPDFFAQNVAAVIAKKTEKDKTLTAESTRLWNEIAHRRLQFDRVEREVAVLRTLDVAALMQFIDRFITMRPAEGVSHRAKLNVQYFGCNSPLPEPAALESAERVAFANVPPVAKTADASADDAAPAPTDADNEGDDTEAQPIKESVFLPAVPVDHRPIQMVDDLAVFKRAMPLFPAFQ